MLHYQEMFMIKKIQDAQQEMRLQTLDLEMLRLKYQFRLSKRNYKKMV